MAYETEDPLTFEDPFSDEALARTEAARLAEQEERDRLASEDIPLDETDETIEDAEVDTKYLWERPDGMEVASPIYSTDATLGVLDALQSQVDWLQTLNELGGIDAGEDFFEIKINVYDALAIETGLHLLGLWADGMRDGVGSTIDRLGEQMEVARNEPERKARVDAAIARMNEALEARQAEVLARLQEEFGEHIKVMSVEDFKAMQESPEPEIDAEDLLPEV